MNLKPHDVLESAVDEGIIYLKYKLSNKYRH